MLRRQSQWVRLGAGPMAGSACPPGRWSARCMPLPNRQVIFVDGSRLDAVKTSGGPLERLAAWWSARLHWPITRSCSSPRSPSSSPRWSSPKRREPLFPAPFDRLAGRIISLSYRPCGHSCCRPRSRSSHRGDHRPLVGWHQSRTPDPGRWREFCVLCLFCLEVLVAAGQAWSEDFHSESTWGPKLWIRYSLMTVGMTLLALQMAMQILRALMPSTAPE
jgi:hypothetical protein